MTYWITLLMNIQSNDITSQMLNVFSGSAESSSITWVRWEAMHMINNSGIQNTLLCISHTRLTALFPGLPRCVGTRKVKPISILLKQKTVSGSGISWTICKSAPRFRQITTPAPHHSSILQAGCPSCCPTNSAKALKTYYCVFHSMKLPSVL